MIKNLLQTVPQLALLYLIISPLVAMPFYNLMLFHPTSSGDYGIDAVDGVKKQDVNFVSADGARLHGWYFQAPKAIGVVLLNHGNGGNITCRLPLASIFLRCHISVLMYDYQGYGRSEGTPTIEHICEDGLAAFDYLVEQKHIPPAKIVIYGESLGGAVACHIEAKRPSAALILQSTFSSLPNVASQRMIYLYLYPRFLYPANVLDNVAVVKERHPPLLIMCGQKDCTILPTESELLFAQASEPKTIERFKDCGHNNVCTSNGPLFCSKVQKFLGTVFQ